MAAIPHEYTYGEEYKKEVEPIWVKMASALTEGEKVHIVAYDQEEKKRINNLLTDEGLNMEKIDFFIAPTDDVWAGTVDQFLFMTAIKISKY